MFPKGMDLMTPSGYTEVSQLTPGTKVTSFFTKKANKIKTVTEKTADIYLLTLNDGCAWFTKGTLIAAWREGDDKDNQRNFVDATTLRKGDTVSVVNFLEDEGTYLESIAFVESVKLHEENATVYHITADGDGTFIASNLVFKNM